MNALHSFGIVNKTSRQDACRYFIRLVDFCAFMSRVLRSVPSVAIASVGLAGPTERATWHQAACARVQYSCDQYWRQSGTNASNTIGRRDTARAVHIAVMRCFLAVAAAAAVLTCWSAHLADAGTIPTVQVRPFRDGSISNQMRPT